MAVTPEQQAALTLASEEAERAALSAAQALEVVSAGTERYTQKQQESKNAAIASAEAQLQLARAIGDTAGIEKHTASLKEANGELAAHVAQTNAAAQAQEAYNAQVAAGTKAVKNLGGTVGLMGKDWEQSNVGMLMTKGGLEGVTKGLWEMIQPMNLAGSVMAALADATLNITLAADEASVELNKTTGMVGAFDDQIAASERRMFKFGIGIEELSSTFSTLAVEVGTFTSLSKDDQTSMAESISLMEKFGISADQTTSNIGSMSAAMGISEVEAVKLQQSLLLTGMENEIATSKMMSDFAAVSDELMAFGDTAVDVFADLAVAAKASNMQVGELLGIATRFDTFEGATESVGKLNALLGGPFLNSLEMVMETDPTKRLSMLQGALNSTGKSFQDMSYYERKAIADAAGLASTADLAKVMSGEFDGLAGNVGKSEEELAAMEETTTNFNTLMDEVKQTLMTFAVNLRPVIDIVKGLMQKFQSLSEETKNMIMTVAGGMLVGKLLSSFFSKAKSDAEGASEAVGGGGVTGAMDGFTVSLGKMILVGMAGYGLFKILTKLAKHLAAGMQGGEGMAKMFESMSTLNPMTLGKTALGIRQITQEMNKLEDGKAIQISTVFDSAAAMASTQTLNTASAAGTTASAAAASSGQTLVAAPIHLTSVIQMNNREFGKAVAKSEVSMKIIEGATGAGVGVIS